MIARGQHEWDQEERRRVQDRRRKARLRAARKLGSHTAEQWKRMIVACDSRCCCCGVVGRYLVKDHVQPIARGGSDHIENLQPLCHSCNEVKSDRTVDYRPAGWKERL